jgi:hypothetical protein
MEVTPNTSARSLSCATDAPARSRRGMMISDGRGGMLSLDLSRHELRWLARGIRSLIAGAVPPGASMLKVDTGGTIYLLNYRPHVDGAAEIQITDLYDPTQHIALLRDLAEMIAALVERFAQPETTATDQCADG